MYHSNFQNKKNMHIIVTMFNSHKKPCLSFASKRVLFLAKNVFQG